MMKEEMKEARERSIAQDRALADNMRRIKHKLIVISGKGGVGKSTVVVNLAYDLASRGYQVGLLDIDIHGPSIAKMVGIEGKKLSGSPEGGVDPIEVNGIKIVTMGVLIDNPDTPVIWRGPLKYNAIRQFLSDINWRELDFLVIDSPPGTGDEPLTILQLIPEASGTIVVTTPQEVALLDSRKAVRFSQTLKVPVLGIIENMSGLTCPHCGKDIPLFKTGGGEKAASELKVPFLGRIPIEPEMVDSSDQGKPFIASGKEGKAVDKLRKITDNVLKNVKEAKI
jgi:ATP-binding protein involved in chromosome partitioning